MPREMTKLKGANPGIMIDDGGGCFLSVHIFLIKLKEIMAAQ